jgi:hypothetical protein
MFDKLMTALGLQEDHERDAALVRANENRRSYPRRSCDQCIAEIDGLNYPIEDWSPGGIRLFCDSRTYQVGDTMDLTMKFRLDDRILRVAHNGKIVRKGNDTVSVAFLPAPAEVRHQFQQVMDDFNVRELARSQVM